MAKVKTWDQRVKSLISKLGSIEMVAGKLGVSVISVRRWRDKACQPSRLAQGAIKSLERES